MRNAQSALAAIAAAGLAVGLAACEPKPQGSDVAAAMPDTSAPREPDAAMTAPDAGATGAIPTDAAPPPPAPHAADDSVR